MGERAGCSPDCEYDMFGAPAWHAPDCQRSTAPLVTCSLRDPDRVCHVASGRCATEYPHPIAECGEFEPRPTAPTPERQP